MIRYHLQKNNTICIDFRTALSLSNSIKEYMKAYIEYMLFLFESLRIIQIATKRC